VIGRGSAMRTSSGQERQIQRLAHEPRLPHPTAQGSREAVKWSAAEEVTQAEGEGE